MNREEIKSEILNIVATLRTENKLRLAECIEKNWDKSALAYSTELNSWKASRSVEKELLNAFNLELARLEIPDNLKIKILDSLEERRILQTAPHLAVTENPRMLCINWLGSLGVSAEDFYVVAMFSGIPFSNSFRPGRINTKENSVNLFPSSMQDGLVYRSLIQKKLIETIKALPLKISEFLPNSFLSEPYTKWALSVCQNIERKILGKENIIFLDTNEVVSNYLGEVLKNKDHVFYKIFFEPEIRKEFMKIFPNETLFSCPIMNGKYEKMENMVFENNSLKSDTKEVKLENPDMLIEEIKNNRLCPALITSFLALAFLNEFKCFGSFYQVEYLPVYQEKLTKLKFMEKFEIQNIPTANLTTGVFPQNPTLYPVDIIQDGQFNLDPNILFGELLLPMKDKLIHGRKNNDKK